LFAFIEPFFVNINPVTEKIRGGIVQHVRVGASEIVLRDHLPAILQAVRKRFPKLRVTLREGYKAQLESWLVKNEIDFAVTLLDGKPPSGTQALPLLKLPLVLLVAKNSKTARAEDLWKQDRIEATLISLPPNEAICKNFQMGLNRRGIDWFT